MQQAPFRSEGDAASPVGRTIRPLWAFTTTILGLLALLIVPVISWRLTERYRNIIQDQLEPGRTKVYRAVMSAQYIRNIVLTYDAPPARPGQLPLDPKVRQRYERAYDEWHSNRMNDADVAVAGAHVLWAWHTGKARLLGWIDGYGREALLRGAPPNQREAALFESGVDSLNDAYDRMTKTQESFRGRIDTINALEIWAEAALTVITVLLASIAWQNFRSLYASWARERDAAARLEVAIRESNHRIKNNLQVVESLLEMQRDASGGQVSPEAGQEISLQVRAMAAVHDFLSREMRGEAVRSDRMLEKLVSLTAGPAGVEVQLDADPALLSVKQATAAALIANELLLNAGKHGATRATVRLRANDGHAQLVVIDNGPGFPAGFDPSRHANLGVALMDTLARIDLGGEITFRNERGACVQVTFPLAEAA